MRLNKGLENLEKVIVLEKKDGRIDISKVQKH